MAQQGLDLAFGLEGTCTSHVSGFGGWPLGVVVGVDGRPTLACTAPDQRLADQQLTPGARQRSAPLDTPRIVSFPPDGRPFGRTSHAIAISGPEADDAFLLGHAATQPDRIAVLGSLIHGNQRTLALQLFQAGQPMSGVAPWTAAPRRTISGVSAIADRCALGWLDTHAVVVAPQVFTGSALQLLVYVEHGAQNTVTVQVPASRLNMTAGFTVEPWVGAVAADRKKLLVGISWIGLDPNKGLRPLGAIDESRASVLRLRRTARGWAPDNTFAQGGLWIASAKEGEITTADHVAVAAGSVVCVGRATRSGARSLFAVSLDGRGKPKWTSRPAPGALQAPTGIALDAAHRVFACGSSRPFDMNYPLNDPAEAVVVCLTPNGQLDPAFGAGGIARFRANGATYAYAVHLTTTGELLVGSIMRWGLNGAGRFHPCITRLTSGGQVDQAFGLGGVARQDGLGGAEVATVDASGRVWSAGVGQTFDGLEPGFHPWDPPRSRWRPYVSVARLAADGGLETAFGLDGLVDHQLHSLDTRLERFSVESLVPLASGGAVLTGDYGELSVNQTTGAISYQTKGTWIARLTPTGTLDGAFGHGGLVVYPARWFELAAELAPSAGASYGALHGWENVSGGTAPLRLAVDGTAAAGFGTGGVKTVNPAPVSLPLDYAPDGEWLALTWDRQRIGPVGLLRCAADGTIDPAFGAGGPTYDPNDYVDATAIQSATFAAIGARWEDENGPHRTLRLADGSYLTLWNVIWQETVRTIGMGSQTYTVEKPGLALLAWTATGKPRPVAAWGNRSAKAIPNAARDSTTFGLNWLGWRYRCALLQPDGSLIVGLEGDDAGVAPSNQRPPAVLRTSAYFVRLTGSAFDLDPTFGGGYVVRRLPGEDREDPAFPGTKNVDYQEPTSIQPLPGGTVVAAVRSRTMSEGAIFTGRGSPDLLADGSVGMMRLV